MAEVLSVVCRGDWRLQPPAQEQLKTLLVGEPFDHQFEFFGVPAETTISELGISSDLAEILVQTQSLPYKAILVQERGHWRLKEFLAQCTGCLGSGKILERPCNSCSGTGWGMRPG